MPKPITFEYQDIKGVRVVTLDSRLSDYGFRPVVDANGKPILKKGKLQIAKPDVTIKDCRHIDGCVYFHLGRIDERDMNDLIEKFQKLLKEPGWKQNAAFDLPDPKFIFN